MNTEVSHNQLSHPFPDPGHARYEPSPGDPARDWDADEERYMKWFLAEIDAGRIEVPPEKEPVPAVTVSPGARRRR
jgi:hypothetical protein